MFTSTIDHSLAISLIKGTDVEKTAESEALSHIQMEPDTSNVQTPGRRPFELHKQCSSAARKEIRGKRKAQEEFENFSKLGNRA